MDNIIISVRDDFNRRPGLRTHNITPGNSGEDFYHRILNRRFYDALNAGANLIVNLDDTAGYPPSFVDESFGRLTYDFGEAIVRQHLEIISTEEEIWKTTIFESILPKWQKRRLKHEYPSITEGFTPDPWWHCDEKGNYELISTYNG